MNMYMPEDKYMRVNGLQLHYLEWGNREKQTLLLLHGFTGHAHVWDFFAHALKEKYHIIALSQRGHGNSQWSQDASYSIDHHFSDIAFFVDAAGLIEPVIVGHSMGGRNALFYSACIPEKVGRLVLVDSRPGNDPDASDALRRHIREIPIRTGSIDDVVHVLQDLYPFLPDHICYHMAEHGFNKEPDGTFVPKYDIRMGRDVENKGFVTEDLRVFMKNIICPVLVVRGQESKFLSMDYVRTMCSLFPDARFEEIPYSSHMPVQENQEMFTRVLLNFLENSWNLS
jgi:esterase